MSVESFISALKQEFEKNALGIEVREAGAFIIMLDDDEYHDHEKGNVCIDVHETETPISLDNTPNELIELADNHDVSLTLQLISEEPEKSLDMKRYFLTQGFTDAGKIDFLKDDNEGAKKLGDHLVYEKVFYKTAPKIH